MQRPLKTGLAVVAAASLFAIGGVSSATAAKLITGDDIQNGSITGVDVKNQSLGWRELNLKTQELLQDKGEQGPKGAKGAKGDTGAPGAPGAKGDSGLTGAVYRVANYKNGGGGSATVACADDATVSQTYTAIAGGVQGGTVDTQGDGFAVNSSFPGRMDWDLGTPKPNRLDGWIVLGNGKYTGTLKVWTLCVPNVSIPVQVTDIDN